jgi:hypothetical protein
MVKSEQLQACCLARVPQWSKRCVPQTETFNKDYRATSGTGEGAQCLG